MNRIFGIRYFLFGFYPVILSKILARRPGDGRTVSPVNLFVLN